MLILFYKSPLEIGIAVHDQLDMDNISGKLPADVRLTYDKSLFSIADAVVFYVPFLPQDLEHDIVKPKSQIWVGWSYECEVNHPWMLSDEIQDLFDIWMTYHLDSDVVLPYYEYSFLEKFRQPVFEKPKDVCMMISSHVNQSRRQEYLTEMMRHIPIDSYGRWKNNCHIDGDVGYKSKLNIIKDYKFTIAFENAIAQDYVTEKFFDPLIVGSVPIYWGAPNISLFSPGNNSFIDVRDFPSPEELAAEITKYCLDENRYNTLFDWKKQPFKREFQKMLDDQYIHPFVRMAEKIRDLKLRV